jgi:predicted CoA-binding protein
MVKLSSIKMFLESDSIAVAGVSRDDKKFGSIIFKELKKQGKNVIPINPNMEEFEGQQCYHNLQDLPKSCKSIIIVTGKQNSEELFDAAKEGNFDNIWVQQSSETDNILQKSANSEKNIICKECILMYLEPVSGVHRFHRGLNKLFGKYPK